MSRMAEGVLLDKNTTFWYNISVYTFKVYAMILKINVGNRIYEWDKK